MSLKTKIKFPNMELCRNSSAFRNQYKRARGLGRNISALDTLRDVIKFCEEAFPDQVEIQKERIAKDGIIL